MELFHIDIETVASYKNYDDFNELDNRGSELFRKKYEKLNWKDKYSDINEAYLVNGGLISTFGKIVCISFGYIDNNGNNKISSIFGDDEKEIIVKFNQVLEKIQTKAFNICGFRIINFDIPWILHKMHKYDVIPADIITNYGKKPWENRIVDLSDDWCNKYSGNTYSFDEMLYELGIESPKSDFDGSSVQKIYYSGGIDYVRKYCERDVESSIKASKKIYNIKL